MVPALMRWRQKYEVAEDRISDPFCLRIRGDRILPVLSKDSVDLVRSFSHDWLLFFSDLSAFILISDSGLLLLR